MVFFGPNVRWNDGRSGVSFETVGAVAQVRSSGIGRWLDLAAFCSRAGEHVTVEGDRPSGLPVPLVFAGLSFDSAPPDPAGSWRAWPAAWAFVPRRVHWGRGGDEGAIHYAWLGNDALGASAEACALTPPAIPHVEDRAQWLARVAAARDVTARAGGLDKVVVARAAQRHRGLGAPGPLFDDLRSRFPACTTFAIDNGAGETFVAATPETLVQLEGGRIRTMALAGTVPSDAPAATARSMRADPKLAHEHAVVVDAIVAALEPLATSVEPEPRPQLRRLANVAHLETPIIATARDGVNVIDVAAALHPTPAVAGYPREAATAWLRRHEELERGWYAGPVGWIDADGGGHFVVALRCVLCRDDGTGPWSFAGAGITGASDPAAEWDETEHKLSAIRPVAL